MRRLATLTAAAAVVLALTGCSMLSAAGGILFGNPFGGAEAEPAAALEAGACLEGMVGQDSDRTSLVSCDGPHRFEVTAIVEWPRMDELIADTESGAAGAWNRLHPLHAPDSDDLAAEYFDWAFAACHLPSMQLAGIDHVEVDGHTAADLWLHMGGSSGVDLSLASRSAFVEGDHRTVCSVAWYDVDTGSPKIIDFAPGVRYADVNTTRLPSEERECWDEDSDLISCDEDHAAQVVVDFDGLEAFGDEIVTRVAEGEATDEDWKVADRFCDELTDASMARPDFMAGLAYYADTQADYGWAGWDGTVDPDSSYRFACLISAPDFGGFLTGDVFAGTAVAVPGAGGTSSQA